MTSTGSIETWADSRPAAFSFSTASFSELLAGAVDDDAEQGSMMDMSRGFSDQPGLGEADEPRFMSDPPPPLPMSPSSFFSIPAGLSPTVLLDSPVLLPSSNVMPSPTTGTFPSQTFNWRGIPANYQQGIKEEERAFSDFSFQRPGNMPTSTFQPYSMEHFSEEAFKGHQQPWSFQEPNDTTPELSSLNSNIKAEFVTPIRTNSSEIPNLQTNSQGNSGRYPASQVLQKRSDDGYNWRKYGQKQMKGSENPRSYYKCTYPNCPTKKKVERSLDGQITEIVYKGSHNHPKPQSTRRNSASSQAIQAYVPAEIPDQSFGGRSGTLFESVATPENSSVSFGEDDLNMSKSGGDEFDEDEPDAKHWKKDTENEGISASGNTTVREPRVVVQTTSDIDILDDGYRWRKYGQKVVKGNPNPRSYYKCTTLGCPVRKHVERASHDLRAVITTYEGKHNHDVPAARGSGGHAANRPSIDSNNFTMAIRPSAVANHPNQMTANSLFAVRTNPSESQAPFTLEMLQAPRSYGLSGSENSMNSYINQQHQQQQKHMEIMLSKAKEEPREDLFLESLLY